MVAQSEVEKLREELGRVRSEGTGNLFGENQAIVGRSVMLWSFFYGCVGRFIGPVILFLPKSCVTLFVSYVDTQERDIEERKS